MAKRTGPTNPSLKQMVEELRKKHYAENAPIWLAVAKKLETPARQKVEVNMSDIERNANSGDTVIVPGVVLSAGELQKSVNVAAWKFSDRAREKIKKAKGKIMTIDELAKENPKGTGVKILA